MMDFTGGSKYVKGGKKAIDYLFIGALVIWLAGAAHGQARVLDSTQHHLRNAGGREWASFAETAESSTLTIRFSAERNPSEWTLSIRQSDVRQTWEVTLNGHSIGLLAADEKDLIHYLRIMPGVIGSDNLLEISSRDRQPDDILVGSIILYSESREQILSKAHVSLEIIDQGTQQRIPSRITIANQDGILQPVVAANDAPVVVRPGYVYTANGQVILGLPSGRYTLYATRGFEYGVDSVTVDLSSGDHQESKLFLRREVETTGWVSCDPHIHTLTWSRHGDASAMERAITIAGEDIEMPVITDHNTHADLRSFARDLRLDRYFTPLTGNEVTTPVGHFNVFPLSTGGQPVNPRVSNWKALARSLPNLGSTAVILNHPRDLYQGFRPFDPDLHIAEAGLRLDQQSIPANAIEVINSSALQSDPFLGMHDWFGLLNHGMSVTPVGASASHEVSRHIVGQARTYIRSNDDNPGEIDSSLATRNFIEGNVMVSFGLLAQIEINDTYGPGELVPASEQVKIRVKVSGPSWARADKVVLYANGKKLREETIETPDSVAGGVKWSGEWQLTMPIHDVYLVAVAEGLAKSLPYWPIAKPYQPVSRDWTPHFIGISGAVWIDADRDGKPNAARFYAEKIMKSAGNNYAALIGELSNYHPSVAVQAAALLYRDGINLNTPSLREALSDASDDTRESFQLVFGN